MHDGFQMVARIPCPVTGPKFYATASEMATMRFLRASGLPVPEVYDCSPSSDNAAKTDYIFMEFMRGTKLSDAWMELEEPDMASVLRQVAQLESRMMTGIPLNDQRFCVGPDARLHMWYGRRSQLDVDRGPYESPETALVTAARGENRDRYLLITPSLVPESSLHDFRIRHPDLQPSNVIVLTSPGSNHLDIVGLLDWQHAAILPWFLLAGIPGRLQNYDGLDSQALIPPSLPVNVGELDQSELNVAIGLYHRRLVHFHYVRNTEGYNKLHHDAWSDPVSTFVRRLFDQAGAPWEGEIHALKATLMEAAGTWGRLTGEDVPCPVGFEPEDLRKMKELGAKLQLADENFEGCRGIVGFETVPEGEVRTKSKANWFLDDMSEESYM
ncbi:hypothetical protein K488DRAFT_80383 [Vararia minispora EC-137]|uniref:Uncharacterized protein n=1 Tax=Vararia minispora EC-137 TaxID=1314806 RepID=A0ACB8QB45_9AGAM|nr:hypothetical protein K488DRAFT_80383 [Vararia minispora EC-137]